MYIHASAAIRAEFTMGLRLLAQYLETHPAVPIPRYGSAITAFVNSTEEGGCHQVREVADMLGVTVTDDTPTGGHYYAEKPFGLVTYRVISIPDSRMARYQALSSYDGCVDPE